MTQNYYHQYHLDLFMDLFIKVGFVFKLYPLTTAALITSGMW